MNTIAKNISVLAFLAAIFVTTANAASYYIDSNSGNDSNTGTASWRAWKSLTKLETTTFAAGDTIYLQCKSKWLTPLKLKTGTSGITITSYGYCSNGGLPQIDVAEKPTWTQIAGTDLWQSDVNFLVSQVRLNGTIIDPARYPDVGYLTISSQLFTGETTTAITSGERNNQLVPNRIEDVDLGPTKSLVGARIVIRTNEYTFEGRQVLNVDLTTNGSLRWSTSATSPEVLTQPTRYRAMPNYGYFFTGKQWMISRPSQWAFEKTSTTGGRLIVSLPPGSTPTTLPILVTKENSIGVDLHQVMSPQAITIKKIKVLGADIGINVMQASNFVFDSVQVLAPTYAGLIANNSKNIQIRNSTIIDAGIAGILANTSEDFRVENNTLQNIGMKPFGSTSSFGQGISGIMVAARSVRAVINNNTLSNIAYLGLFIYGMDTTGSNFNQIINNKLTNTCVLLRDCSAIYTTGRFGPTRDLYYNNALISGNTVENVIGGSDGAPNPLNNSVSGIYLDDYAYGVRVQKNTIINSHWGMLLHGAATNIISENTFYTNRDRDIYLSENIADPSCPLYPGTTIRNCLFGNQITLNKFMSLRTNEVILESSIYSDTQNFATYSGNTYSDFFSRKIYKTIRPGVVTSYTLDEWKASPRGLADSSSLYGQFGLAKYTLNSFVNSVIYNFDLNTTDWGSGWGAVTKAPYSVCGNVLDCFSYRSYATTGTRDFDLIKGAKFSLVAGKKYILQFDIKTTLPTPTRFYYLLVPSTAYNSIGTPYGPNELFATTQWQTVSMMFTATTTTLSSFYLEAAPIPIVEGQGFYLDNFSISEVNVNDLPMPVSDVSAVLVNKSPSRTRMSCPFKNVYGSPLPKCYEMITFPEGNVVDWSSFYVEPNSSRVVIWKNHPYRDSDFDTVADWTIPNSVVADDCPNSNPTEGVDYRGCNFNQ